MGTNLDPLRETVLVGGYNQIACCLGIRLAGCSVTEKEKHHRGTPEAIVADTPQQDHRNKKVCKLDVTQKLITKMWLHTFEKIVQGDRE